MQSSQQYKFTSTMHALVNMENMLKCSVCKLAASSPVTLGCCEHIFCSVCCEDYLGSTCPVCNLPAQAKDAEVDRQLFNMATLCGRLRDILEEASGKTSNMHDSAEESIYCTPNQGVIDVASITNPDFTEVKVKTGKSKMKCPSSGTKKQSTDTRKIASCTTSQGNGTIQAEMDSVETDSSRIPSSKIGNGQKMDKTSKMSDISNTHVEKSAGNQKGNKKRGKQSGHQDSVGEIENKSDDTRRSVNKSVRSSKHRSSNPKSDNPNSDSVSKSIGSTGTTNGSSKTPRSVSRQRKSVTSIEKMDVTESPTTGSKAAQNQSRQESLSKSSQDDTKSAQGKEVEKKEKRSVKSTPTRNKKQKSADTNVSDDVGNGEGNLANTSVSTPDLNNSVLSDIAGSRKPKHHTRKAADDTSMQATPTTSRKRKLKENHASRRSDKRKMAPSPGLIKKNAKGETLLHVAAIKNDVSKVLQLLEGGANPNVRDNAGWTPLHEACNHGYTEVARLLLDHGAMMNVPGFENDSPLHDAISNNSVDCVKLLVSRGASINTRNLHGLTPTDYAKSKEMKEALKTKVTGPQQADNQVIDVLEYQQPCLVGTGLSREEKSTLQKTASQLKIKLCEEVTPEVTHIVTVCNSEGMCPRTVKIVQGILSGKWILNTEWLSLCREMNSVVCEEAFEVQGLSMFPNCQSPYKGRMNRKQQLPGLFDGCWFYFNGEFEYSVPSKDDLLATIKLGGGKILSREPKPGHLDATTLTVPYHVDGESDMKDCCTFVVFETGSKYQPIRTKHICSVPASWVIDCAAIFTLLPLPE